MVRTSRFLAAFYVLLSALVFLFARPAFSQTTGNAIRVDNISGASNFTIDTSNTASAGVKIFGGIAGTCATADPASTCNSCEAGTLLACNPRRIHPSLRVTISFTVTSAVQGFVRFQAAASGGTFGDISGATISPNTRITTSGVSGSVSATWGSLCSILSGDANCDTTGLNGRIAICVTDSTTCDSASRVEISVAIFKPAEVNPVNCAGGVPATNDAICGFEAFPGDQKIFVQELDLGASYPNNSNVPLSKMIIMFSEVGFNDITHNEYPNGNHAELIIDNNGDVSPDIVEGLENDVTYYFRAGMLDAAQNLYNITSDAEIATEAGCGTNDDPTCKYMATPAEVYGLLTEDFNCFITTAAYGSQMAHQVQAFREFRNTYLVPHELGRKLIFYYYDIGPKAARWLAQNDWAKPFVRVTLLPAYGFVKLTQVFGFIGSVIVSFGFLLSLAGLFLARRNSYSLWQRGPGHS